MLVFKKIPEELDAFEGDVVLAVIGEDERPLLATNAWLDWRLYGAISELIQREVFSGKLGEKCMMPTYGKFKFDRLILLGGGDLFESGVYPTEDIGQARWQNIAELIDQTIRPLKIQRLGLSLPRFDLADHERAVLKSLQQSRLPGDTHLFMSRAIQYSTAASL